MSNLHGFSLGLVFFTLMRRMNCSSTSLCNGFHPLPCLLPHTNLFATVSKICLVFDGTRDWMTDWTGGTGRTDFIHKKRWDERKSNWVLYFSMVSKTSGTNDLSLGVDEFTEIDHSPASPGIKMLYCSYFRDLSDSLPGWLFALNRFLMLVLAKNANPRPDSSPTTTRRNINHGGSGLFFPR